MRTWATYSMEVSDGDTNGEKARVSNDIRIIIHDDTDQ